MGVPRVRAAGQCRTRGAVEAAGVPPARAPGAGRPRRGEHAPADRLAEPDNPGWRAYYRAGVPREQFEELDAWLEEQVRGARLRVWAEDGPGARSLDLAGLESLARSGRHIFQPEPPPSVEGYAYRIPLEGEAEHDRVAVVGPLETLTVVEGACRIVARDGSSAPLAPDLRAVVIADGATCGSAALRHLLERGVALRFVAFISGPNTVRGRAGVKGAREPQPAAVLTGFLAAHGLCQYLCQYSASWCQAPRRPALAHGLAAFGTPS